VPPVEKLEVLRTFTVGAPATALYAGLHAVADAAFDAIARKLIPGTPARDLAAAAAVIGQAGFTAIDDLVQPNVVTHDGRAGVQTGELLLVTDQGPQRLHAYRPGLVQLG